MRSALLSKRPTQKYIVGTGAGTLLNLFPVMPVWLADHLVRALGFCLKELQPLGLQELSPP
jgi:hypothetical protein